MLSRSIQIVLVSLIFGQLCYAGNWFGIDSGTPLTREQEIQRNPDEAPNKDRDAMQSPFKACKDVIVLDQDFYQGREQEWQDYGKSQGMCVQTAHSADWKQFKSLDKFKQHVVYQNFLDQVAAEVEANANQNADFMEFMSRCYSSPSWNSKCPDLMAKARARINDTIPYIRHELALTRPGGILNSIGDGIDWLGDKYEAMSGNHDYSGREEYQGNPDLKSFERGIPNIFGKDQALNPEEKRQIMLELFALKEKARENYKVRAAANDKETKGMIAEMLKVYHQNTYSVGTEFRALVHEHELNYLRAVQVDMPILSVIDSPKKWENGNPVFTDEQMKDAFMTLAKNARDEARKVAGDRAHGTIEKDGDSPGLLHYINYPQVEDVLAKNKDDCAAATTLAQRESSIDTHRSAALSLATLAPGFGWGLRGARLAGSVLVGRAISASEAMAISGTAMGAGFYGSSWLDHKHELALAQTRSGVGGDREAQPFTTAERIDEKDSAMAWNAAFGLLGAVPGFQTGKLAWEGAAKRLLKESGMDAERAASVVASASRGDLESQKLVDQAVNAKASALWSSSKNLMSVVRDLVASHVDLSGGIGGSVMNVVKSLFTKGVKEEDIAPIIKSLQDELGATKARVASLERTQKKATFNEVQRILNETDPAFLQKIKTPEERRAFAQSYVAVARYGKVNDPKKIAAILMSWDPKAKEGLVSVYQDASIVSQRPEFQKITNLRKRREAAFEQALKEKGMAPAEVRSACVCANVCSGGTRVARAEFELAKLDSSKVCAMSETTVWLSEPKI